MPWEMTSPARINVLAIINPERTSGADMMLLDAMRQLAPSRYRVILGLLTDSQGAADLWPDDWERVEFRLPGLNGLVWLRFFLV
ncbi:MAG: hypothetical protein ACUVRZ_08940, partial [Desulfobacca sp.]|uniref:hypothetical protein n=1 Tax=Desulfobacca sp. TaxID=2067990 RepID=UPI00404A9DF4